MTSDNRIYQLLEHDVIRQGLCTHCGTCVGLSDGQLEMRDTPHGPLPHPTGDDVHLPTAARDACPGYRVNYPDLYRYVAGKLPDNWLVGPCQAAYISYAQDESVRRQGASGGVLSQILIYLLEQGLIDGAVVVQQGQPQAWQATPIIARSRAAILQASQSVYAPVPVNVILREIATFDGRLAFVGLPDQVAAIRRLQQLDHPAVAAITYVLGPYVGTNMVFEAVRSFLRSQGVRDETQIETLRYREGEWPGYLYIRLKDGREFKAEKFYYNYLIPFFITNGTLQAVDFTNELTDISVGDAWHPKYEAQGAGFSVVLARSDKGQALLHAMADADIIALDEIPVDEALTMHGHMLDFKKRGAFIRMQWRSWLGKRRLDYGYRPAHIPLSRYLVEAVITAIFAIGRTPIARWMVEQLPLSVIGPLFNTLRKTWKNLSKPVKRKGLGAVTFEETVTLPDTQTERQHPGLHADYQKGVRLAGMWERTKLEWHYITQKSWTFTAVGEHWDATEDYDDVNAETYSYFQRFVDGLKYSTLPDHATILDICCRTGNGTAYFAEHGKVKHAICADVSRRFLQLASEYLTERDISHETVFFDQLPLPIDSNSVEAILCFETMEHVPDPVAFIEELARVIQPGGELILTTPNYLWEPVHWLAAILDIHHSEGPHRFLRYHHLIDMVRAAGFTIDVDVGTILIPDGPDWLVQWGRRMEARFPRLAHRLALRRVLICHRTEQ